MVTLGIVLKKPKPGLPPVPVPGRDTESKNRLDRDWIVTNSPRHGGFYSVVRWPHTVWSKIRWHGSEGVNSIRGNGSVGKEVCVLVTHCINTEEYLEIFRGD
jgi:hypothetical protein